LKGDAADQLKRNSVLCSCQAAAHNLQTTIISTGSSIEEAMKNFLDIHSIDIFRSFFSFVVDMQ